MRRILVLLAAAILGVTVLFSAPAAAAPWDPAPATARPAHDRQNRVDVHLHGPDRSLNNDDDDDDDDDGRRRRNRCEALIAICLL